ncbi:hypothetical protein GCM10009687_26790 [Asanoa iriomotensis]|uniref:Uncharacterized protein n=1 Tax=Asanoa iriomotensis TaxID=234613 RepID=A0ABQ4C0P3_9ACTN|nr:hypothetical protein Air01nite_24430 [Asanoa iriomotensis]
MIPPTTPCAGMPRNTPSANRDSPRLVAVRSRRWCRKATTRVARATTPTTQPSIRLLNSMTPWMPISAFGTYEASVHRGQVGQPRPEPVSRTAPPVTTMATFAMMLASAKRRSRGITVRDPT